MNTTTLVRWLLSLLVGGSVVVFAWRKVGWAVVVGGASYQESASVLAIRFDEDPIVAPK